MIAALPVVQRLQLAVCVSCCASNLIHVVPHGLLKGHVCWPDGKLPCPNLHLFLFFCSKKSNVTSRTITTWICQHHRADVVAQSSKEQHFVAALRLLDIYDQCNADIMPIDSVPQTSHLFIYSFIHPSIHSLLQSLTLSLAHSVDYGICVPPQGRACTILTCNADAKATYKVIFTHLVWIIG